MNTVPDAASSAPSPVATTAPHSRHPAAMPKAAASPRRAPAEIDMRSTSAVSMPGVAASTMAAREKATRLCSTLMTGSAWVKSGAEYSASRLAYRRTAASSSPISRWRKQSATWSLTMPTACMKA